MDEYFSPSYDEYTYEKRAEGKMFIFKLALIVSYVLFIIAYFLVCYVTRLIPLFALCPLITWILIYFTWHYVSYDVYYTFEHGYMQFGKIVRRKKKNVRSPLLKIETKSALLITKYKDAKINEECKKIDRIHDFSSSKSSESLLIIVYETEKAVEAVVFDATPKLQKLLVKYSQAA